MAFLFAHRGNKLNAEAGKALASALKKNAVLTQCTLIKNFLDIESAKMLAKIGTEKRIMLSGIKHDQTEANVCSQYLKPADGILIASDLRVSSVLKKLVLSRNSIKDEGSIAIGESLKTNSTLVDLELIFCDIGAEGAKAIAAGLSAGSAVLTSLDISSNFIGPELGIAMAEVLKKNAVLTTIECVPRAQKRDPRLKICTHMFSILARTCQYPGSHLIGSYTRDLGVCAGIAALFGSDPSRHTPDVRSRRTLQTHTLQAQTHQT